MKFTIELPMPPSVNACFANVPGKGRVKTKIYKEWKRAAAWSIVVQSSEGIRNRIEVSIDIPGNTAMDCDNPIKPILDALVASGRIDDDKHVMRVSCAKVLPRDYAKAIVTVKEWGS